MATQAVPILDRIIESRRAVVAEMKAAGAATALEARARAAPPPRDFRAAIRTAGVALIAECKQRSPSGGLLQADYDPARLARRYAAGGVAAISVLTEPAFFGGSPADLSAVRAAVDLPVLCKDFIIDPVQLLEARAAGADAVLLIVAVLDDASLPALHAAAVALGMQALVEVHTAPEVPRALAVRPAMIGINNRDLTRMRTDRDTTGRLRPLVPAGQAVVSESGIERREDVVALGRIGVDAVLVGEALLRAGDLEAKLRELTGQ
ncbi:MAG: indole-3-glycerol phosphate synthase TrpC [Candidatus Dormibacteraeota bacterium]|nr:indole-3-glycerol phosphate synthase TrpC [Candidatus Dormibacteraeota bacterium]